MIVSLLQKEIDENINNIPDNKLSDIQHYLDHDEYGMAFEYLYLEIMENENARCSMEIANIREIGLLLELDKECMIEENFWEKFEAFLLAQGLR